MSGRVLQILGRFPTHLEAARPGKQFAAVVEPLAGDLDQLSTDVAAVRRAHRIGNADTLRDILLLGGLHGLAGADLAVYYARAARLRDLATQLDQAIGRSADDRDRLAETLFDVWGVDEPRPRLPFFAPARGEAAAPDLDAAARALVATVRAQLTYRARVEAARRRVVRICEIHAGGNGTVRALLEGAANALDLEIDVPRNEAVKAALVAKGEAGTLNLDIHDALFHSTDMFWHSSFVRDRAPLARVVPTQPSDKLVRMNETIAVSELADQMLLRSRDLQPALGDLGLAGIPPDTALTLAQAESIAAAFSFAVERFPRGVAHMERTIVVAALASQIAVRVETLLARLNALGAPDVTADSAIAPELAARAARKYGYQVEQTLPVGTEEVLGMEENPLRREQYTNEECTHAHLFTVIRRGFGREPLQARVIGWEDKTVGPMVVNREEGHGVGYFGTVPAGQTLAFMEEGRVFLEGGDVTAFAFSWQGACFAEAAKIDRHDYVFDGPGVDPIRRALFAVATPAGALDRDFTFPHAGDDITVPGIAVGMTRMAFFVQQANLSSRDGTVDAPVIRRVTPHSSIGFADQSVFAAQPPDVGPKVADLHLSWLEHEAYALRIIIPRRFALLDQDEPPITKRVAAALERFRPAGVQVRVEYLDDRWVLGHGFLLEAAAEDPNLRLRGETVLWPTPPDGN